MKILFIILTFFSTLQAVNAEKEVRIGTYTFTLIEEEYNEYGDKGVTMMLYAKGADRSKLPQFRFVMRYQSGSCVVKNVEEGSYTFEKDSIITHSNWERIDNDHAPIGDRMQVYKLDENGSFYVSDSKVYIERTNRNDDAHDGMKYLYEDAKTEEEKSLLQEYISSVEQLFEAKFVMGEEAKKLRYEVNKALHLKHGQRWE